MVAPELEVHYDGMGTRAHRCGLTTPIFCVNLEDEEGMALVQEG